MNIKIPKLALKRRETRLLNFKIEKKSNWGMDGGDAT